MIIRNRKDTGSDKRILNFLKVGKIGKKERKREKR